MTIAKEWVIGIVFLVVSILIMGGYELLQEHDARLKAEIQTAAQQKSIDQAKADAQTVQQHLADQLKALEAQRQQPATPQQIVIDGSKLIPNLPQPIVIQQAPVAQSSGQQTADSSQKTPALSSAPQQQLVVPQSDFQAIQNAEINCQESAAKLSACSLQQADLQTELTYTKAQSDEWETTAKGGSWWHKTLTAAKWIGIGAVMGYVAGHKW